MITKRHVLLRADASHAIGFGHVGRLYALYEELVAHKLEPVLLFGDRPGPGEDADKGGLTGWLHDRGLDTTVSAWTKARVLQALDHLHDHTVLVIDGRNLSEDIAPCVRSRKHVKTIVIDDQGSFEVPVHAVVNHNFHAPTLAATYHATHRLLGRHYALLRKDIRRLTRGSCRPGGAGGRLRVVVTFGGSDPVGATARLLRILPTERLLDLVVIEGPAFHPDDSVAASVELARAAGHTVEVRRAPRDPGALFATADAAIASAGGTLGELAYLGCPAIAYAIVEDQIPGARAQAEAGLIAGGRDWTRTDDATLTAELAAFLGDAAWRTALRDHALATIDGDGPRRIITEAI